MVPERCVSVVIVTYQSSACIGACLDSLRSTANEWLADVIVVDNASSDGTAAALRTRYAEATLVENPENFGFGKAVNIGARHARGSLLLILNPDTIVPSDMVRELAVFMRYREEACACGPRIMSPDGVFDRSSRRGFPTPWNTLGYFFGLDRIFPRSRTFGHYHHTGSPMGIEMTTECLSGACMMVRKKSFDEIGGFDEDYFLFGEDIDLCWRLNRTGEEIWYVPAASLVHRKGASMQQASDRAHHEFFRAMRLFFDKRLAPSYSRPLILAVRSGISAAEYLSGRFSRRRQRRSDAESAI